MFKCVIIDDEELARVLIKSYVDKIKTLQLVGSFESPLDSLDTIKSEAVDLVFLDIQMPELKGTDFAKIIPPSTRIIFTTAYSEYALKGYELNALDYLLKPISFDRFVTAVNKLQVSFPPTADLTEDTLVIKSGYDLHKIKIDDITHIESNNEYVMYHTPTQKVMSHQTLKSLEKTLDASKFMRVHRSCIVNKTKVTSLKGRDLLLGDITIPVSDSYYDVVRKELF